MIVPDNIIYKMFCSYPSFEGPGNCTEEAVGEMAIYLDNNPMGDGIMHLPICQKHLESLDRTAHE